MTNRVERGTQVLGKRLATLPGTRGEKLAMLAAVLTMALAHMSERDAYEILKAIQENSNVRRDRFGI